MIYLDHAATTPIHPEVVETITEALVSDYGNPSSIYRIGKQAKRKINTAREKMAELLAVNSNHLYFTSGATEANNWALVHQARLAKKLGKGNHIVATAIEHPSVRESLLSLESEGFEISWIHPDDNHQITVEAFDVATTPQTIGWVAMAVNNEVGSILPVKELGQRAKVNNLWFHVDGVQAMNGTVKEIIPYVTSFSASAHKFNGPKGIGFLIYQPWDTEMMLEALIHGGSQEFSKRAGTENTPYILGMAKALELILNESFDEEGHFNHLFQYLIEQLDINNIEYKLNGDGEHHSKHIVNLWFPGLSSSQFLIQMDLAEIYISAGSACSAGSLEDSLILKAYYPKEAQRWQESIRISFGRQTQIEEIDYLIKQIKLMNERS
ncbi:cysteine desulfurase family protein [Fundicoccus sp. Sow4_H7]|uniref:cysteine desulfurase family protein n=1 Tax=Fundicoccus sp. Sow4_H7 TaxID=3438784 RepID=UPI003F8FEF06